jgi:hypothetical protein
LLHEHFLSRFRFFRQKEAFMKNLGHRKTSFAKGKMFMQQSSTNVNVVDLAILTTVMPSMSQIQKCPISNKERPMSK